MQNSRSKDDDSITSSNKTQPKSTDTIDYIHNKSFFNVSTIIIKKIQLNAPFPAELLYEHILKQVTNTEYKFLDGYIVKDTEGVLCQNEDIVKRQSGVFKEMAKQIAKGIFKTGVISLSLPIRIFEPKSMLARYCDSWSSAPILLKKAGRQTDKLEAFKSVISFVLSSMFLSSGQMKPFNPLLGETFEGSFSDGTKIYVEHTSHQPCRSHYYMTDPDGDYTFSGWRDISIDGAVKMIFTNNITMVQKGKDSVYLKSTGQTISYHLPKVILGGMVMGSRYLLIDGHMKFEDVENNLKATIIFNKNHANLKNRRVHDFYGMIYKYDYPKKKVEFYEEKIPKLPKSDIYSEITGSWLENIIFDGKLYWSIPDSKPLNILPKDIVCPSDGRYREDLNWLSKSWSDSEYSELYEEYAQAWKVALEVQQRYDKFLREEENKKRKKMK